MVIQYCLSQLITLRAVKLSRKYTETVYSYKKNTKLHITFKDSAIFAKTVHVLQTVRILNFAKTTDVRENCTQFTFRQDAKVKPCTV